MDETRDVLESQLEKLFSDVVVTGIPSETSRLSAARDSAATPRSSSVSGATFSPSLVSLSGTAAPKSRRQTTSKWITSAVSPLTVTVVILFVIVLMIRREGRAQSSNAAPEIRAKGTPVVIDVTATRTAAATPTARIVASATKALPSATPRLALLTEEPTPKPPNRTTEPSRAPPTATPTPTLAPAQRLEINTATPVTAYSIGLGAIPTPVPRVQMPSNAINVVLLGSDQRPGETSWRTDVIIVVSIDPDLPSVSVLSIPRDTWLYVPNWTYQRINLADVHGELVDYPGGGPGLVKATIEYNLGIHIDYYARVDFAGLMQIVDSLGGVDILLDCPVEDGFPDDPITEDPSVVTQISYTEPGVYHLDGKHALWLARSRKTTSEFARSRRQHRILQAIWNKAERLGYIASLPALWEDLTDAVETDLSLQDVLWLASVGLKLDPSQVQSGFIDGRYLTGWVTPGGANVYLPHTEEILDAVDSLLNPYPYTAPQGFNKIEVWNGSGHPGWGFLAADRLARNGFEIAAVSEADEPHERSTLVDFSTSSKGSPVPLIRRLFDVSYARIPPGDTIHQPSGIPFRLIVGADYQPCERPVPARWIPPPTPPPTPVVPGTEG